jgi:cell fate (sporulation/competence/biofilm development) regulator YlbF (YheA/YmcA/DUF963 family)
MKDTDDVAKRLFQEHNNLQEKIEKLRVFIEESRTFKTIPAEDQDLLQRQLPAMRQYRDILRIRCERVETGG